MASIGRRSAGEGILIDSPDSVWYTQMIRVGQLRQKDIICEHCGSTLISKDPFADRAQVQEISQETGEPIGPPKTFYMFKCLSCGGDVYLEKFEG